MANNVPRAEVAKSVISIIAAFTGLSTGQIKEEMVLTDPPLSFDSTGLAFLAMALRGYIKSLNDKQTITVTVVRKPGLTVGGLIDLVHSKVNS
jgi:hypothetical protein